jgi:hypothetical protein
VKIRHFINKLGFSISSIGKAQDLSNVDQRMDSHEGCQHVLCENIRIRYCGKALQRYGSDMSTLQPTRAILLKFGYFTVDQTGLCPGWSRNVFLAPTRAESSTVEVLFPFLYICEFEYAKRLPIPASKG